MMDLSSTERDFYERKINRLETSINSLEDELAATKIRLRTAEDFQIKYDLLLRQSQQDTLRLNGLYKVEEQRREAIMQAKLASNDDKWRVYFEKLDLQLKEKAEVVTELNSQQDRYNLLYRKYIELEKECANLRQKREYMELFNFKVKKYQKYNESLQLQIYYMKRHYEYQQTQEISSLKTVLSQNYKEKLKTEREVYYLKIGRLYKCLADAEQRYDEARLQSVATDSNLELQKLKELLISKNYERSAELAYLQQGLYVKNDYITRLQQEKLKATESHLSYLKEKRACIRELYDKIFQKEKQHEQEIFALIERLDRTKQEYIAQLKYQIKQLNIELTKYAEASARRANDHQDELAAMKKDYEEEKSKQLTEKRALKAKINYLNSQMKYNIMDRYIGDTQFLLNSLRYLDIREDNIGDYENGITFLERQVKKYNLKLYQKQREISKLVKDMNAIRSEADQEITELKEKYRKEKKYLTDRIIELEEQSKDLHDLLRAKYRDLKKNYKDISNERLELEAQNKALKEFCEYLQRDYNRVIENRKTVELSYRYERERNLSTKGDLNTIKKQKFLYLYKQKNELQLIFREKEYQLKTYHELQLNTINNELAKLKHKCALLEKDNQLQTEEIVRYKQAAQEEKEENKYAEYSKKMATLNLEIALTKNIYDTLLQAKSQGSLQNLVIPYTNSSGYIDYPVPMATAMPAGGLLMSFHP